MNKEHIENLEAEILNGLAEIESLEPRKTPALTGPGTIFGGILTINFDNANDTIVISQTDDTISVAYADNKGHSDTLTFAAVGTLHKIVVNSGAGNDSVKVNVEDQQLDLNYSGDSQDDEVSITAGAGNDVVSVYNSDAKITIDGGTGNDSLFAFLAGNYNGVSIVGGDG